MKTFKKSAGFLLFSLIYYLPLYLDEEITKIQEPRVSYLFETALQSKEIILYILINIALNITILFFFYIFSIFIGNHINKTIKTSRPTSFLLAFTLSFLFINSINQKLFNLSSYSYFFSAINNKLVLIVTTTLISTITIHAIIKLKNSKKLMFLLITISILITSLPSTKKTTKALIKTL